MLNFVHLFFYAWSLYFTKYIFHLHVLLWSQKRPAEICVFLLNSELTLQHTVSIFFHSHYNVHENITVRPSLWHNGTFIEQRNVGDYGGEISMPVFFFPSGKAWFRYIHPAQLQPCLQGLESCGTITQLNVNVKLMQFSFSNVAEQHTA